MNGYMRMAQALQFESYRRGVAALLFLLLAAVPAALSAAADPRVEFQPEIQAAVGKVLVATVEKWQAHGGWAVVQEVRTGRVLAMASHPAGVGDAAVTACEPGSLQKTFTVAAALNERLVTPDTRFDAGDGRWIFEGQTFIDHMAGPVSVRDAIVKSSRIAVAKIALEVGPERLERYFRGFGFGRRPGGGLPGEAAGLLAPAGGWDGPSTARAGIGENVAVTALQLVNAYSCIANGGALMRPYFATGGEPEVLGHPVTPEVAGAVRELLGQVTREGGTGPRARIAGHSVAGKTGSARKRVDGTYSDADFYASFAGFVPAGCPAFCIVVTIDSPKPEHTGGAVAAPAFAEIASAAARALRLPPEDGVR